MIKSTDERTYFLIYESRYKKILGEIRELGDIREGKIKILDVGCYPYRMGQKGIHPDGHVLQMIL